MPEAHRKLTALLRSFDRVLVAYSGGIDSTLVFKIAHDTLGPQNSAAAIAVSPSLAHQDLLEARLVAQHIGSPLIELPSTEIHDPNYTVNNPDRCYFCKTNVYDTLIAYAGREGYRWILDGTNLDDLGDHRPGLRAAREHGVRSPLRECGLTKATIRQLSQKLDLPNWNKPANACLSSRIPHGSPVTTAKLSQIEKAELILKTLGYSGHRVRHHDTIARLELPPAQLQRALDQRETLLKALLPLGFRHLALDLAGYTNIEHRTSNHES